MHADMYHDLAMRTRSEDQTLQQRLTNAALGLTGEAGEVADLLKKHLFHGHDLEHGKLISELGDVLWYVTQACDALGVPLSLIMEVNIEKLKRRYPEGFSAAASKNRGAE